MGRIASGFDRPDGLEIQTHVKAILQDPRFEIAYVADRVVERARSEAKRFGLNSRVLSPEDAASTATDVLCIASPDGTHSGYARNSNGSLRVVLAEKPLEGTRAERLDTLSALERRKCALVVHHQRRWIPGLAGWMAAAKAGEFGRPLSVTGCYTRGLRHNAVHAFDLLAGFIGTNLVSARSIGPGIADRDPDDLTRSAILMLRHNETEVPVTLHGVDGRVQTVFTLDIRFERARVLVFDEAGIRAELYRPAELALEGFAPELRRAVSFHDDPPKLMAAVWRNIADHLEDGTPLACAGIDALAAYDLVDAVEAGLSA